MKAQYSSPTGSLRHLIACVLLFGCVIASMAQPQTVTRNISLWNATRNDSIHLTIDSPYSVAMRADGQWAAYYSSSQVDLMIYVPGTMTDSMSVVRLQNIVRLTSNYYNSLSIIVHPASGTVFDPVGEALALRIVIDSCMKQLPILTMVPSHHQVKNISFITCNDGIAPALRYLRESAPLHSDLNFKLLMMTPVVTAAELSLMSAVTSPVMILAGTRDCLAPSVTNAVPLYNRCVANNRCCIVFNGGNNCQMYFDSCSVTDTSCRASMSYTTQFNNSRAAVVRFLNEESSLGIDTTAPLTILTNRINRSLNSLYATARYLCPGDSSTLIVDKKNYYFWLPDSVHAIERTVKPTKTTTYSIIDTSWNRVQSQVTIHVSEARRLFLYSGALLFSGDTMHMTVYNPEKMSDPEWSTGDVGYYATATTEQLVTVRSYDSLGCAWWSDSVYIGSHHLKPRSHRWYDNCWRDTLARAYAADTSISEGLAYTWFDGSHGIFVELDTGVHRVWYMVTRPRDGAVAYSDTVMMQGSSSPRIDIVTLHAVGDSLFCSHADAYNWYVDGAIDTASHGSAIKMRGSKFYTVYAYINGFNCPRIVSYAKPYDVSPVSDAISRPSRRTVVSSLNSPISLNNSQALDGCRVVDTRGRTMWSASSMPAYSVLNLDSLSIGFYMIIATHGNQQEFVPLVLFK